MSKRSTGQFAPFAIALFLAFSLPLTAIGEQAEFVLPSCYTDEIRSLPSIHATVVPFKSISFGPGEWEMTVVGNGCIMYHAVVGDLPRVFSNVTVVLLDGTTLTRCYGECSVVYVCNGVVHLPPTDFLTQIGPFSNALGTWAYVLVTDIQTWLNTFDVTGNFALALDGVAATLAVQMESVSELPLTEAKIASALLEDLVFAVDNARDSLQTQIKTYSANVLGLELEEIEHVSVCTPPTALMEQTGLLVPTYELVSFWETTPPEQVLSRLNEWCEGQLNVDLANAAICAVPFPSEEWYVSVWDTARTEISSRLGTFSLLGKLGTLLFKYGWAIVDCYGHFPDWDEIEKCFVEDHGLDPNLVRRLLNALKDP